jgi:filamentous hemagglutinin
LFITPAKHEFSKRIGMRVLAAKAWRQQQGALMQAGKMRDALAMAITDVRGKFGSKYNAAIQQAISYARGAGWIDKRR